MTAPQRSIRMLMTGLAVRAKLVQRSKSVNRDRCKPINSVRECGCVSIVVYKRRPQGQWHPLNNIKYSPYQQIWLHAVHNRSWSLNATSCREYGMVTCDWTQPQARTRELTLSASAKLSSRSPHATLVFVVQTRTLANVFFRCAANLTHPTQSYQSFLWYHKDLAQRSAPTRRCISFCWLCNLEEYF